MPMHFFFVVVRVVLFFLFFSSKPETRGLPTDIIIHRSILVHFLFTDWSVYLHTRSAVSLDKMTESFFITIGTQEFR